MTIADKAVLVTGATRGIGQALVQEALNSGAEQVYAGTRQPLASPTRVAAIHERERTEGNPLFVREVIGQRLAPLSSDTVQVLSAAAVVGREDDLELVVRTLQAVLAGEGVSVELVVGKAVGSEAARNLFRREGEYWTIGYEGAVVRLRDAKGLRHLARLLAHPGREFHAVHLEAAEGQPRPAAPVGPRSRAVDGELTVRPDLGDAGPLLDAAAKAAYQARLVELRAELAEAEGFNDLARAARARQELDFLVAELARAVGLGGRDRRAASHAERARLNVTRAIRAAMANLARANPALGRHLAATIRTGRYCSYTPDPRLPIAWER
jgi:NAD(P)-dependent dehydrogenase (short-subunit alcohol dehydrogenase family)